MRGSPPSPRATRAPGAPRVRAASFATPRRDWAGPSSRARRRRIVARPPARGASTRRAPTPPRAMLTWPAETRRAARVKAAASRALASARRGRGGARDGARAESALANQWRRRRVGGTRRRLTPRADGKVSSQSREEEPRTVVRGDRARGGERGGISRRRRPPPTPSGRARRAEGTPTAPRSEPPGGTLSVRRGASRGGASSRGDPRGGARARGGASDDLRLRRRNRGVPFETRKRSETRRTTRWRRRRPRRGRARGGGGNARGRARRWRRRRRAARRGAASVRAARRRDAAEMKRRAFVDVGRRYDRNGRGGEGDDRRGAGWRREAGARTRGWRGWWSSRRLAAGSDEETMKDDGTATAFSGVIVFSPRSARFAIL